MLRHPESCFQCVDDAENHEIFNLLKQEEAQTPRIFEEDIHSLKIAINQLAWRETSTQEPTQVQTTQESSASQDPSDFSQYTVVTISDGSNFEESNSAIPSPQIKQNLRIGGWKNLNNQKPRSTMEHFNPNSQLFKPLEMYRHDELAKHFLRKIAKSYHELFVAILSRKIKREGNPDNQRLQLVKVLQILEISEETYQAWIQSEKERKILDLTFLTVKAKNKLGFKREELFNGTKKASIRLFTSEVGKTLFLAKFTEACYEALEHLEGEKQQKFERYFKSITDIY